MDKRSWVVMAVVAWTLSCGGGAETPPSRPSEATDAGSGSGSRTLPIPGVGAPAAGATGSGPLTWDVPSAWAEETPSNSVRLAQYRVPGDAGDGECIVFYFGPGQGGDPQSNAERWAGQFSQPDGSSSLEKMTMTRLDDARLPVMIVEVTGTYDGGMSGPIEAEGYMLLGGIAQGPDAPWFFKLIGPEQTVRAHRDAFVSMMESLRADG